MGLIANPASGKDVRRLVASATTIDNQQKVDILRRALAGLAAMGVAEVPAMPDPHHLALRAARGSREGARVAVRLLDMPVNGDAGDTVRAAALMRAAGVGCILVLGGDGTVSAAAQGAGPVPLVAVSTGTNNVVPRFVEGTTAGLAAGAVAVLGATPETVADRHRRLEVWVAGRLRAQALVDVATLAGGYVGARAVWNPEALRLVVTTRAEPGTIGLSALAGLSLPGLAGEVDGVALWLDPRAPDRLVVPLLPGLMVEMGIADARRLPEGERLRLPAERPLVVAVDGEREFALHRPVEAHVVLRRDGPYIVDVARAMALATKAGLLRRQHPSS